jgi:hypothetical protein
MSSCAPPLTIAISVPSPVLEPQRGNNTTSTYSNQPWEDLRAGRPRKRASCARQHDNNDGGDKVTMMGNGKRRHNDAKKKTQQSNSAWEREDDDGGGNG